MLSTQDSWGAINIIVDSRLNFAGDKTKIKIRDQQLRLYLTTTPKQVLVPPGIYELSTVKDNGQAITQIVQVSEDEKAEVKFYLKAEAGPDASLLDKDFVHFISPAPSGPKTSDIKLVEITQGAQIHMKDDRWVIRQENPMEQLTSATFVTEKGAVIVNLPVSGGNHFRSMWCQVFSNREDNFTYPKIKIAPTRTIASSMEQMLDSGRIFYASQVAFNSMKALLDRYPDPTGAMLGVIALFKVGQLYLHKHWLQEFNNRYEWLPDGKIFLALILAESENDERSAIELIKIAAHQKILYSDSFSVLLSLIRTLPVEKSQFESIFNMATLIDWRSRYLCYSESSDLDV
ncbi:hypothetical protein [Pseudomonas syringae]|uniref:Uncharacterized protein n=1 Tax=Pseudomonas syringae TaxID=317 RepID=A0A085VPR0_PSESX|nr:hypothetical protein [Pseudomonas syringae]KFE57423.1 hypothetical protein IV01_03625 [Pseudomonas syringae]